jgi:hypothetical protein
VLGAVLVGQDIAGWIVRLVVSVVSIVLAALLGLPGSSDGTRSEHVFIAWLAATAGLRGCFSFAQASCSQLRSQTIRCGCGPRYRFARDPALG